MKNSNLRILILRLGSPYQLDGVNNSIYILAETFMMLKHEPIVIGGFGDYPSKNSLTRVFDVKEVPNIVTLSKGKPHVRLLLWLHWLRNGGKIIKNFNPDIIITAGVIPIPKIGFRILYTYDVPKIFWQKILGKALLNKYNAYVFISSIVKKSFLASYGISDDRCSIIPLPIEVSRYKIRSYSEREHAILFVDNRRRRNLLFALEIFNQISKYDKDVMLYIVGIKDLFFENFPRDRVVCLGLISRKALRELYSKVKLLLIPSSYEGFGYPVLEAFATGTPVVGSSSIPSELLIDGYNGFRIKSFELKPYVKAVLKLLGDDRLWIKLHKNAIKTASRYDAKSIALQFIELYEKLGSIE